MVKKFLNILMISHHRRFKTSGRSQAMAQSLVKRGHQVTTIATSDKRISGLVISNWSGVRIIESPDLLWDNLRSGWDLWDLINRLVYLSKDNGPYDLIHCFETRPTTIYPALYYRRRYKLPLITDWNDWFGRGGIISILRPKWYQVFFAGIETYYEESFRTKADGLTVISSALAQRATKLGVASDKICRIPGGTFPEKIPALSIEECRKRFGYSMSTPILGFASADSHIDLEIVLESLAIISRKYPDVKMIITGHTGKSLINSARRYGVAEKIILTGFVPGADLPWHLGCANIFVLPFPETVYNLGRWPNKIGLYMCLGRPTVSNPCGDIKPLFDKNPIGLLANWEASDFSQKIIDLLENPELASQLGENARKVGTTQYNWDNLICQLENFYYQVLESKKVNIL